MSGDASPVLDPGMPDALASGLMAAAVFNKQTMERVNNMKFLVLRAFEAGENSEHGISSAHHQTSKDITTKFGSRVEGRAEAVEQFKRAQEAAEFTLSNLKRRVAGLQTEYNSESRQAKLEASNQDRERIVKHVSSVEQTRQEQIEAENTLHTLLDLKHKVQAQDSHALRISQETIMMSPRGLKGAPAEQSATMEKAAASAIPGSPVIVKQDALSPQGKTFREGQQVSFVKLGRNGWTLVRDASGQQCWLATQHLSFPPELAQGTDSEPTHVKSKDVSPDVKQQTNAVVGIALGLGEKKSIVVAGVKPGAPAHRSRMIAPGDELLRVDGKPVGADMELKSVVQLLCGPVGSIISLGVMKASGDELDVVLVREQPSTSVYSSASQAQESPASLTGVSNGIAIKPVQPDSIPPRDGPIHNLYSSQASLPPSGVEHGLSSPHYRQHHRHEDSGMSSVLAHMNLSNVESTAGVVYRPGPSQEQHRSDRNDPSSPVMQPPASDAVPRIPLEMPHSPLMQHVLAMPEQRLQAAASLATTASRRPPMIQDSIEHLPIPHLPQRTSPSNSPPAISALPGLPMPPFPFAMQRGHAPGPPDGFSEIGMAEGGYDGRLNALGATPVMSGITKIGMADSGPANYHNPFRKSPNGFGGGAMMLTGSPGTPEENGFLPHKHPLSPRTENMAMGKVVPVAVGLERFGSPLAARRSVPGSHSDWAGFMSPLSRAP